MNKITVTTNKKASMSDFYGIFFEDINHAADGGLYGEMIRNRAFEFSPMDNPSYQALTAWKRIEEGGASVSSFVSNKSPFSKRNPNYLILEINKAGTRAGIKNLGYNSGIAVKENESYNFSCYAKSDKPCEIRQQMQKLPMQKLPMPARQMARSPLDLTRISHRWDLSEMTESLPGLTWRWQQKLQNV